MARRDLCESAKKGDVCPDDLCRGADVTLCGFDKERWEQITRDAEPFDYSDEDDFYRESEERLDRGVD